MGRIKQIFYMTKTTILEERHNKRVIMGFLLGMALFGFLGNMWSGPVYNLAIDTANHLGVKYNISFPWADIMKTMTVPQAFMITFVFLFLYLVLIGFLLYVCNLLLKEIYGILIVFGIQVSGYLLQQEGVTHLSLMAKSIPGYFIDGNGGQGKVIVF